MGDLNSFSIVIPVYNAEKYIAEMIESVIAQTYPQWELIIIDDGSKDSSGSICDTYSNDKIKVFHNENGGQIFARIDGINKAKGDYTLVLDADDAILPNCLELVNEEINRSNCDMVIFPYQFCDENLKPNGVIKDAPFSVGKELEMSEVLYWVISTCNHGLVNKAVRTRILQRGAQEAVKKRLRVNGDYALIVPIVCNIKNATYIDECLYLYRIYENSISHNYSIQHLLDTELVSEEVMKTIIRYSVCTSELDQAVRESFWNMMGWMTEGVIEKNLLHYSEAKAVREHPFFRDSVGQLDKMHLDPIRRMEIGILEEYSAIKVLVIKIIIGLKKCKRQLAAIIKK